MAQLDGPCLDRVWCPAESLRASSTTGGSASPLTISVRSRLVSQADSIIDSDLAWYSWLEARFRGREYDACEHCGLWC